MYEFNLFFYIIIGVIIFEYILSIIVKIFNIKSLDEPLPKEFSDTYEPSNYIKSQAYTKSNTNFSFLTTSFSVLLSLYFILSGFYNDIDLFIRNDLQIANDIVRGLCFFGILFIITDILNTPFSVYKIFVIEEKYGFNKTTVSTFIIDKIKGYFLLIIIGAPVLYLILNFFTNYGDNAWFYVWLFLVLFSFIMQPIFNLFIAPLFNKFTPIEEGPLLDKIKAYLHKVNFPVKKLEIVDGSKRSSHSNAYFSGMGKNKRIALFDTLVEQMDDNEIVSVIAHEVGHYKLKHVYSNIFLSAIQSGVMLYIMSLFIENRNLFDVFQMENTSVYASLVFFSMLYSPISFLIGILFTYISRKNEFAADKYSVDTAKMPSSMISALKKLSKENLSNLNPHWLNVFLNYTHPPVLKRIEAIRSISK